MFFPTALMSYVEYSITQDSKQRHLVFSVFTTDFCDLGPLITSVPSSPAWHRRELEPQNKLSPGPSIFLLFHADLWLM